MPKGSSSCGMLEGTTPSATVNGTHVQVLGPFPPGSTSVQIGCAVAATDSVDLTQKFPATLEQLAVIVKKVGDTKLSSPQIGNQREMSAQNETYIAATGPALPAGQTLTLTLSDLPHHSAAPRMIALSLAAGVILIGVFAAGREPEDDATKAAEQTRLVSRRERLLADMVRLERDRAAKPGDERKYVARREELVTALEHVYGALDTDDPIDIVPGPAGRAA
jgi:hypothetical protein